MTTLINGSTGIDKVQDSIITPSKLSQPLTLRTKQTLTGTDIDFTDIPSWVKRITVIIDGMDMNSTSSPSLQLGTSSGFETTNYTGIGSIFAGTYAYSLNAASSGFCIKNNSATGLISGIGILTLTDSMTNNWVFSFTGANSLAWSLISSGAKILSGTLDRIRFTTTGGGGTFDAGSVNILYEG